MPREERDFRVTLADTGEETMTGGRIQRAARYLDGDTFMVTPTAMASPTSTSPGCSRSDKSQLAGWRP